MNRGCLRGATVLAAAVGTTVVMTSVAGAGDPDELFYAPWRDDPRPLGGLFHGAYAFLGAARFWNRQRRIERDPGARAHVLFARWRAAALESAQVLARGGWMTPLGHRFVTGMISALDALGREEVSGHALAGAARLSAAHRRQWAGRYGTTALRRGRPIHDGE